MSYNYNYYGGSFSYEKIVGKALKSLKLKYEKEVTIDADPGKRYDFYFEYNGKEYLIEVDG